MEVFEGLRRRKGGINEEKEAKKGKEDGRNDLKSPSSGVCTVEAGTYWLTRIVFLRSIGFIYCKLS